VMRVPAARIKVLRLPAQVPQVLDAKRHRAHVRAALPARLLGEPVAVPVRPVGISHRAPRYPGARETVKLTAYGGAGS
jgi:hypothetical protein